MTTATHPRPRVPLTLPNACRSCGGPIQYSGRGRRPTTCSAMCKRAIRADDVRVHRDRNVAPVNIGEPIPGSLVATVIQQLRDQAAARAEAIDDGLVGIATRRPSGRLGAATPADAIAAEYAEIGSDAPPFGVVRLTASGDAYASDSRTSARSADAASLWLAENHPDELATFPASL